MGVFHIPYIKGLVCKLALMTNRDLCTGLLIPMMFFILGGQCSASSDALCCWTAPGYHYPPESISRHLCLRLTGF